MSSPLVGFGAHLRRASRALALVLALLSALLATSLISPISAHAATHGIYLLKAMPFYAHPLTGVIEDSGQNPAIGQGMTESVLNPKALLEVEADGRSYISVRFSLIENIQGIQLFVQPSPDTDFAAVTHTVMREDMANDSADIRFAVPDEHAIVRAEFFVIPMGRTVIFYMAFSDPVAVASDATTSDGTTSDAATSDTATSDATDPLDGFVVSTKVDAALAASQRAEQSATSEEDYLVITAENAAEPIVISQVVDPDVGLVVYTKDDSAAVAADSSGQDELPLALFIIAAVAVIAIVAAAALLFYRAQLRGIRRLGDDK